VATLGDAFIEVHADTSPFERELVAELEAALIRAEAVMRQRGRDSGNALADGVELAVKDRADDIGDTLAEGVVHGAEDGARRAGAAIRQGLSDIGDGDIDLHVRVPDEDLNRERNRLRNWIADTFGNIGDSLGDAFSGLGSTVARFLNIDPDSPLGKIFGQPAVLVSLLGSVAGVIIGLSQVLVPVGALILALPGLLSTVGVIVLGLMLSFEGLGRAISGVFSAKNAKEFADALKGVNGPARDFVASFKEAGDLWRDLVRIAQNEFFYKMDRNMRELVDFLGPSLRNGVKQLAASLGNLVEKLFFFLESPKMKEFIDALFPAVAQLLDKLGGPLVTLLDGLFSLIIASLPFISQVVTLVGKVFENFNTAITGLIVSGQLEKFFLNAENTLMVLGDLALSVFGFVVQLLTTLENTGMADAFLLVVKNVLDSLTQFLASDAGKKSIETMIALAAGLVIGIGAVILTFLELFALLQDIGWFVSSMWDHFLIAMNAVGTAIQWVEGLLLTAGQAVFDFFFGIGEWIGHLVLTIDSYIGDLRWKIAKKLAEIWRNLQTGFVETVVAVINFAKGIPGRIASAFGNAGSILVNAGRNIINGLIDGIKAAIPGLSSILGYITDLIPNIKGPESKDRKLLKPAGMAVMEGFGEGIAAGAKQVIGDLSALTGMISMTANPNTFNFGRGAIQQNFNGTPTAAVATTMGNATGGAIANAVNQQTMRAQMRAA
jgi:hypothetical protein